MSMTVVMTPKSSLLRRRSSRLPPPRARRMALPYALAPLHRRSAVAAGGLFAARRRQDAIRREPDAAGPGRPLLSAGGLDLGTDPGRDRAGPALRRFRRH